MSFPRSNLSSFHNDVFKDTLLGQLCGKNQLFRDRYLVLRMLGRGGFGVTFLAKDYSLPHHPYCVIKQLCPRLSELKAINMARHRFKREAQILATLGNHSQIPLLLDYFVLEDEFYLVQEYIKGVTLARLVRQKGPQIELVVKRILREVLELLTYVHHQGVIHRDIKPQNVILSQDRRLVLIDFGAVKQELVQGLETSGKAVTTHFVGTVGFAPPEQFALRPVYASDIYALGVTCLYLLTGKAPLDFASNSHTGKLEWQGRVELTKSFTLILDKMLQPSLEKRYKTVEEILQDMTQHFPQDNLSQCMNHQSMKHQNMNSSKEAAQKANELRGELPTNPNHFSVRQRTAQAIRDWKVRRSQKNQNKTVSHPKTRWLRTSS